MFRRDPKASCAACAMLDDPYGGRVSPECYSLGDKIVWGVDTLVCQTGVFNPRSTFFLSCDSTELF